MNTAELSSASAAPDPQQVQAWIEQAWVAFRAGRFGQAEKLSAGLVQRRLARTQQLPLAQVRLLKATAAALRGERAEAANTLYQLMVMQPGHYLARQTYLSLLRDEIAERSRQGALPQRGRRVFGLGTGRSGSTSLAHLFAAQADTYYSHEHAPLLPWRNGGERLAFHLERMQLLRFLYGTVVDVSHWWLPHTESIIAADPQARFVVLRRGREQTVKSFVKIKGGGGAGSIHHWVQHDGRHFKRNAWDECYPKYLAAEAGTLEAGAGRYWDDYYSTAQALQERHPQQVRMYDIGVLEDAQGQQELLRFCGYEQPQAGGDLHKNKEWVQDSKLFWMNPFAARPA